MNGIALIHTGWAENVSEESKAQEQMVSRENNEIMKNIRDKSVWHTIAVDGICSFVDLILHFDRPWDVYPWPQGAQVCQVLSWKLTSTNKAEYTQDTPQTSHALWGFDIMNFKGIKILPSEKHPQNIAQKK